MFSDDADSGVGLEGLFEFRILALEKFPGFSVGLHSITPVEGRIARDGFLGGSTRQCVIHVGVAYLALLKILDIIPSQGDVHAASLGRVDAVAGVA